MKKFNIFVILLSLICFADAGYRVYKQYHKVMDKYEKNHN